MADWSKSNVKKGSLTVGVTGAKDGSMNGVIGACVRTVGIKGLQHSDMPTTICACCTGNGSTLGLLGKCQRVGVDPAPGRKNAELPELPKSETLVVSESAGLLWLESTRNVKKLEKQKSRLRSQKVRKSETKQKCLL